MLRAILKVLVKLSGVICNILKLGSRCGNPFTGEFKTSKSARPVSLCHASLSINTNTSLAADDALKNVAPSHDVSVINAIALASIKLIIFIISGFKYLLSVRYHF